MARTATETGKSSLAGLGLILGFLSAVGPLSIDLYLPALPRMAQELNAQPGDVQRTLSAFFLALAAAQIPIGSFGDRFGRKLPLYIGLSLFIVASLACAVASSINMLILLRFVQGFCICAGTTVSRAMIRDLKSGPEAARLMAMTFLIIGISPVLAPLLGSYLLAFTSWRGLFVILAGAGALALALAVFVVPESLPPEKRAPVRSPLVKPYLQLLGNGRFIAGALVAGFATTIPYAYLTAAPFALTGAFSLSPRQYSLVLGVNAICSIGTTQLSPRFMKSWGARSLLLRASLAGLLFTAIAGLVQLTVGLPFPAFELYSLAIFATTGLMLTPAAITALDAAKTGAGAAAGLLGTLQLIVTACASGAISLFPAFSVLPLLLVLGSSCALALILSRVATAPARVDS